MYIHSTSCACLQAEVMSDGIERCRWMFGCNYISSRMAQGGSTGGSRKQPWRLAECPDM